MSINDWNTIFLIFVLLLIAGYVYVLQERINKLEDRQDIQQKINDELHKTFIRYSNGSLEHDLRVAERLLALEKDTHKQAEYNRSFAKSIRRVANLARGDENAGKRC